MRSFYQVLLENIQDRAPNSEHSKLAKINRNTCKRPNSFYIILPSYTLIMNGRPTKQRAILLIKFQILSGCVQGLLYLISWWNSGLSLYSYTRYEQSVSYGRRKLGTWKPDDKFRRWEFYYFSLMTDAGHNVYSGGKDADDVSDRSRPRNDLHM